MVPRLVLLVKSHAGGVHVKKGKPLVAYPLDQGVRDALRVSCKKPCYKGSAVGQSEERGIKRRVLAALGRNLCFEAHRGTRRRLALGEAVDRVVKEKIIDVHIPP